MGEDEGLRSDRWYPDLVNYRDEIERAEESNRKETHDSIPRHYSALLLVDGMIGQCLIHHQSMVPSSTVRTLVTVVSNRAHENLLSAWHLVENGAYGAASVLTRAIYEDWITLVYYRAHPLEAERWWNSGQWTPVDRDLVFGKIKDRLIREGILPASERRVYARLSSMAHPSADSAMVGVRPPSSAETCGAEIRFVAPFHPEMARHSATLLLLLGLRILKFFEGQPGMSSESSPIGRDTPYGEVVIDMWRELNLDETELLEDPKLFYGVGRKGSPPR